MAATDNLMDDMSSSLSGSMSAGDPVLLVESDQVCLGMARQSVGGDSIPIQSKFGGVTVEGSEEKDGETLSVQVTPNNLLIAQNKNPINGRVYKKAQNPKPKVFKVMLPMGLYH